MIQPPTALRTHKRMGYIPDLHDDRDRIYKVAPRVKIVETDLRGKMGRIEDQGNLGSCVFHGLTGGMEYLEKVYRRPQVQLSRLAPYYDTRVIEDTVNEDAGAMIRDAVKVSAKIGVGHESYCPYKIERFTQKPSPSYYVNAEKHRVSAYERVLTVDDMLNALSRGFPVIFGMSLTETFWKTGKDGLVLPSGGSVLGGHCMLVVGAQLRRELGIVRNSWGTSFGDRGYCYVTFEMLATATDCWIITIASV